MKHIILLLSFTILLSLLHLLWGSVDVSLISESMAEVILLDVRWPRALTAIGAGSGLALAGQYMQTWFRNSLAGPSVLGITSGGSLGVALLTLAGGGVIETLNIGAGHSAMIVAALGSLSVLVLVFLASKRFTSPVTLLVFGLMVGYTVSAIIVVLQSGASAESLQAFVFWGMGTFGNSSLNVAIVLPVLAVLAMVWGRVRRKWLDAWTLGENIAITMGTSANKLKMELIIVVGVVAGAVTAVCGPIAFLGLATPHLVKMISSERSHKYSLPLVLLSGACIALVADLFVRAPWSESSGLPLNAVLALFGAPIVIAVIWKRTHEL